MVPRYGRQGGSNHKIDDVPEYHGEESLEEVAFHPGLDTTSLPLVAAFRATTYALLLTFLQRFWYRFLH